MATKVLYQTLEDRGNYDEVERDAPFLCSKHTAWLSPGYYFWDTFIDNAHWWGKKGYAENYIICKAQYDFDEDCCFDLVGDTGHIEDFIAIWEKMKEIGTFGNEVVVAEVIAFLRKTVKDFNYKAVRASSTDTRRHDDKYSLTIKYRRDTRYDVYKQRLDLRPLIQICIFNKGTIVLEKLNIVYPENV